jgi:hypothetical protein
MIPAIPKKLAEKIKTDYINVQLGESGQLYESSNISMNRAVSGFRHTSEPNPSNLSDAISNSIEIPRILIPLEIPFPVRERSIPVPQSNWSRLESRIKTIENVNIGFTVLTGVFESIMISAPIGAVTLGNENSQYYLPLMIVGAASLICTLLCVAFAHKLNSANSAKKADILDEMKVLRIRYIPDQDEQ